jgi:hypothetical protein
MFRKAALVVAFMLSCAFAGAQTKVTSQNVTIPARTITQKVILNGRSAQITFTIPAQTVSMPKPAVPATPPALPDGLTYANGVLTVAGSIKAASIDLTGGSALPTSANGLYLLQLTGGFLKPVPYVPYSPPTVSVFQHNSYTTEAMHAQGSISEPAVTYPTPTN